MDIHVYILYQIVWVYVYTLLIKSLYANDTQRALCKATYALCCIVVEVKEIVYALTIENFQDICPSVSNSGLAFISVYVLYLHTYFIMYKYILLLLDSTYWICTTCCYMASTSTHIEFYMLNIALTNTCDRNLKSMTS